MTTKSQQPRTEMFRLQQLLHERAAQINAFMLPVQRPESPFVSKYQAHRARQAHETDALCRFFDRLLDMKLRGASDTELEQVQLAVHEAIELVKDGEDGWPLDELMRREQEADALEDTLQVEVLTGKGDKVPELIRALLARDAISARLRRALVGEHYERVRHRPAEKSQRPGMTRRARR